MYREKITLEEALELEGVGDIMIVDASPNTLEEVGHPNGKMWKDNFTQLQIKVRHISPDKLMSHYSAKYIIEFCEGSDKETGMYSWRYLHGVETEGVARQIRDNIEYIYILSNPGYPDLVKIGMTRSTVHGRAKGINATATLYEWVPIFALPVKKGFAMRVEQQVHKYFSHLRQKSDQGNEREFFSLDPHTAFDAVKRVGSPFQVGNPIVY